MDLLTFNLLTSWFASSGLKKNSILYWAALFLVSSTGLNTFWIGSNGKRRENQAELSSLRSVALKYKIWSQFQKFLRNINRKKLTHTASTPPSLNPALHCTLYIVCRHFIGHQTVPENRSKNCASLCCPTLPDILNLTQMDTLVPPLPSLPSPPSPSPPFFSAWRTFWNKVYGSPGICFKTILITKKCKYTYKFN